MNKTTAAIIFGALVIPGMAFAQDKAPAKSAADTPKASAKGTARDAVSEIKETVGDTAITAKIKADFAKDKAVSALNIKVDTDQKGMVVLSGNAKSKAEADKAVAIAKGTQGVTSVKNDIVVGTAPAKGTMDTPKATTSTTGKSADKSARQTGKDAMSEVKETMGDTAITTKIKADFAKDKQVSALNIKVDTDQKGMVVLSGDAKTKAEADKAVSIAKATKGVTSVKNDIKIAK